MRNLSRVVWSEGMYLGPHHFQAQSRYFEDSARFATSSLWFEPWGLVAAQLDAEALKNGTVSLLHARGIFPDGMVFHMPESDPLPETRNIADLFPPTGQTGQVLLAGPSRGSENANPVSGEDEDGGGAKRKREQNGSALRYRAEVRTLYDENTGRDEKPVHVGRK